MRLTKDLGYPYHEFCGDVLDPFFSGDRDYQLKVAREVKEEARKNEVKIFDIYSGMATHRFHGLSHSHPAVRKKMQEWILGAMDIALEMGVTRLGGHWDAISVEVLGNRGRYQQAVENLYQQFRELSKIAKDKGMTALYQEQMYIPSEIPWTIAQAQEFLLEVNKENDGVPVYLTVDTGHQAGETYGANGDDLSFVAWIQKFASTCEIIHLQQTTPDASHHWAFTPEYNQRGHVRIEEVLRAIEDSHREYDREVISDHLAPVDTTILVVEVIPGSTKTEPLLLDELAESSRYLRSYIPEGGMDITIP